MAASIPFQLSVNEASFEQRLRSNIQQFQLYEDKANQRLALTHVPLEDLKAIAQAKYDSSSDVESTNTENVHNIVQDMLLLELMDWFKNEFFKWMNSPVCPTCSQPTSNIGMGVPTPVEMSMSAGRVEIYTCKTCFSDNRVVARFPRYNDPTVLLESRTGRCGEWANCFALICRAVGFEVRHVLDHTDHVWVEIFSSSLNPNRWVHADPCENSYDNPLLYEVGWGKALTYIIAVSHDDVQDVTPRYSKNYEKVLSRRNEVRESWLVTTIIKHRRQMQMSLSESRKVELVNRWAQEIGELMMSPENKEAKGAEKVGRESGSLAWRLARQEIGDYASCTISEGFIWQIGEESVDDGKFILSYDCSSDTYVTKSSQKKLIPVKGWQNGMFSHSEVFRKVEHDWKMVYLATRESSPTKASQVCWKFNIGDTFCLEDLKITIKYSIFQSDAKFNVVITTDKNEIKTLLETNVGDQSWSWDSKTMSETEFRSQLNKSKSFTITCELTSGHGNDGWQKVQLFRQQLENQEPSTFSILSQNTFNVECDIKKIN